MKAALCAFPTTKGKFLGDSSEQASLRGRQFGQKVCDENRIWFLKAGKRKPGEGWNGGLRVILHQPYAESDMLEDLTFQLESQRMAL
jgi:hypothetical protein